MTSLPKIQPLTEAQLAELPPAARERYLELLQETVKLRKSNPLLLEWHLLEKATVTGGL